MLYPHCTNLKIKEQNLRQSENRKFVRDNVKSRAEQLPEKWGGEAPVPTRPSPQDGAVHLEVGISTLRSVSSSHLSPATALPGGQLPEPQSLS